MQIVQKIYIESQEMMPDMKIKTGVFWYQNKKYYIKDGKIKTAEEIEKETPNNEDIPF